MDGKLQTAPAAPSRHWRSRSRNQTRIHRPNRRIQPTPAANKTALRWGLATKPIPTGLSTKTRSDTAPSPKAPRRATSSHNNRRTPSARPDTAPSQDPPKEPRPVHIADRFATARKDPATQRRQRRD